MIVEVSANDTDVPIWATGMCEVGRTANGSGFCCESKDNQLPAPYDKSRVR